MLQDKYDKPDFPNEESPQLTVFWLSRRCHDIASMEQMFDESLTPAGFLFVSACEDPGVEFSNRNVKIDGRYAYRIDLVRFRNELDLSRLMASLYKAFRRIEVGARVMVRNVDYRRWKTACDTLSAIGRGGVRSLVSYDYKNNRVTKRYHPCAIDYFRRECLILEVLSDVEGTCPVLSVNDERATFEMPVVDENWKWKDRGWNLYPVSRARKVLSYMKAIHQRGVYMVDWNPGSFLFDQFDRLQVVDFEFAYQVEKIPTSYSENADFQGLGHETVIPGCRYVSYEKDWQDIVGVTYQKICEGSSADIAMARVWFLLSNRWPNYLLSVPFKRIIGPLKRRIRVYLKVTHFDDAAVLKV